MNVGMLITILSLVVTVVVVGWAISNLVSKDGNEEDDL